MSNKIKKLREEVKEMKIDTKKEFVRNSESIGELLKNKDAITFTWHKRLFAEMIGIAAVVSALIHIAFRWFLKPL